MKNSTSLFLILFSATIFTFVSFHDFQDSGSFFFSENSRNLVGKANDMRQVDASMSSVRYNVAILPPPQAVAAGFTHLDFDDEFDSPKSISPDGTGQYKWYATQFFSPPVPKTSYSVSNGILTVTNGNGVGATISTAGPKTDTSSLYNGKAWKHGYFEARLKFDPSKASQAYLWPAFWSSSIEHAYDWSLGEWGEIDFMEAALINTGSGAYAATVHHWKPNQDIANQGSNIFKVPAGTDFNQFHTYGALWVSGKITFYFDGQPGVSVSWQPGQTYSILDAQHMYMVLGTDGNWPMEVDWVRVWQSSLPAPDTKIPSVSITKPQKNAVVPVGTNTVIKATASDNVGVTKVEFLADDKLLCTDSIAPYKCTWTPKVAKSYKLKAKAFDAAGNMMKTTVSVIVR